MFRFRTVDVSSDGTTREVPESAEAAACRIAQVTELPAPLAEYDARLVGRDAQLRGLTSSSTLERGLNGRLVQLVAWHADISRFEARLIDTASAGARLNVRPHNLDVVPRSGDLVFVKSTQRGGQVAVITGEHGAASLSLTPELLAQAKCVVHTDRGILTVPLADVEVRGVSLTGGSFRELGAEETLARLLSDTRGDVVLLGDPSWTMHMEGVKAADNTVVKRVFISRALEDPRMHALPADPALRVAMPPPLPATAQRWTPPPIPAAVPGEDGWNGCVADMRPRSLAMARGEAFPLPPPTRMERFILACMPLDQTSEFADGMPLHVDNLLGHIALNVANDMPFRFVELNADSIESLFYWQTTEIVQAPTIVFASARDNWAVEIKGAKLKYKEFDQPLDRAMSELLPLKAYEAMLAAIDANYLPAMLLLLDAADKSARKRKLLKPLADALLRAVPAVRALAHATAPFDAARLAVKCGELLEQEAARGGKADWHRARLLDAVKAYQLGAEIVTTSPQGRVPSSMWVEAYNALGLALKRYGTYDRACFGMAERAYRWAMSCPRPREDVPVYMLVFQSVLHNVLSLLEHSALYSNRELAATTKHSIRASIPHGRSSGAPPSACATCAKALGRGEEKRCASCHVAVYCSKECQTADWPQHKRSCRFVRGSSA